MSDEADREFVRTRIWREEPEPGDRHAATAAYCHGYDVYGEMLGRARWVDMLFLLFRGEAPSAAQVGLLESLAVALANPGPRDPSVHAAMCGGACGSPAAASLMAALAVGAGGLSGGREVLLAMEAWADCETDIVRWQQHFSQRVAAKISGWYPPEHAPGFDPRRTAPTRVVLQTLDCLAGLSPGPRLVWLKDHRVRLETATGTALALAGVAAAAYADLGFSPEEGEMLHLLLRLPGAAVHALEQGGYGHKKFPFFAIDMSVSSGEEPA